MRPQRRPKGTIDLPTPAMELIAPGAGKH